jgi:hypothetical protein
MNYNEAHKLLISKGWIKGACSSCSGNPTKSYTHPAKPNELIKLVIKVSQFKYYQNDRLKLSGSFKSLEHHYFID